MSEVYDATYAAARSAFSGVRDAVADAARDGFDCSRLQQQLGESFRFVADELVRPSVLFKAQIMRNSKGGWFAFHGDFTVAAKTPDEAMRLFDRIWTEKAAACRACGCTDDRACEGGCSWVEPDLCSACAGDKS